MSTTPQLPGFLASLAPLLTKYGYGAVGLMLLLEDFGIPVPGETTLIAAAVFAGAGQLNVVGVGVVAFFAAILGDNIGYLIGRLGGRTLVLKYGRYIFITSERLDKAEDFFGRHGGKIVVVARFIEGLRQANGIIAGITGMHWLRFLMFNAIGAALWVGTWVSVGYLAGNHIGTIYDQISRYSYYVLAALGALVILLIVRAVVRRRRRAAAAGTAEAAETPDGPPEEPSDSHHA